MVFIQIRYRFFFLKFYLVDEIRPIESITAKTGIDTDIITTTTDTPKSADCNLDVKLAPSDNSADEAKALNNTASNEAAVSKTITTVTVNVTQAKVVVELGTIESSDHHGKVGPQEIIDWLNIK